VRTIIREHHWVDDGYSEGWRVAALMWSAASSTAAGPTVWVILCRTKVEKAFSNINGAGTAWLCDVGTAWQKPDRAARNAYTSFITITPGLSFWRSCV
jgi:hypothetical protein